MAALEGLQDIVVVGDLRARAPSSLRTRSIHERRKTVPWIT